MYQYISKNNFISAVNKDFEIIVKHIVLLYYPMWFDIKCKPGIVNGHHYVYTEMTIVCDILPKTFATLWRNISTIGPSKLIRKTVSFLFSLVKMDAERQFAVNKSCHSKNRDPDYLGFLCFSLKQMCKNLMEIIE